MEMINLNEFGSVKLTKDFGFEYYPSDYAICGFTTSRILKGGLKWK